MAHLDGWMEECGKELNLDAKEIKKQHVTNGKIEGIDKCFVGCVLKKEGTVSYLSVLFIRVPIQCQDLYKL